MGNGVRVGRRRVVRRDEGNSVNGIKNFSVVDGVLERGEMLGVGTVTRTVLSPSCSLEEISTSARLDASPGLADEDTCGVGCTSIVLLASLSVGSGCVVAMDIVDAPGFMDVPESNKRLDSVSSCKSDVGDG